MTQELVAFLEDQVEFLDWYRRVVSVAVQLQGDGMYSREEAVGDLAGLAREMAMALGVRWRE